MESLENRYKNAIEDLQKDRIIIYVKAKLKPKYVSSMGSPVMEIIQIKIWKSLNYCINE